MTSDESSPVIIVSDDTGGGQLENEAAQLEREILELVQAAIDGCDALVAVEDRLSALRALSAPTLQSGYRIIFARVSRAYLAPFCAERQAGGAEPAAAAFLAGLLGPIDYG